MSRKLRRTEVWIETHEIRIIRSANPQSAPERSANYDPAIDVDRFEKNGAFRLGVTKREILIKEKNDEK